MNERQNAFLLLWLLLADSASAMITTTAKTPRARLSLQATTREVIFDGPEWASIQETLSLRPNKPSVGTSVVDSYGRMTVVVGVQEDTGDRIVGIASDDTAGVALKGTKLQVYQDSVAKFNPKQVNDAEAMNTMIAALTGIQCTLPRVEGVGGADTTAENSMVSGKVVIMGGSEYACFAAEGLAALGSTVALVSTNKVTVKNQNVQVLPPAVGDDEIGFASFVGEFDSLLDTAEDERPSKGFIQEDEDDDNDNNDNMLGRGTTLRLLKQKHNCDRYVSSMTKAQSIVNKEGVFFGPGKVKNHLKDILKQLDKQPATFQSIVPPPSFGQTVETLLQKGIVYRNNKDFLNQNNLLLRGWSLKDFMEVSMWPTDSSGGGSRMVRFGLPVLEDEEEDESLGDEFTMISAPPKTAKTEFIAQEAWDKEIQEGEDKDLQNPNVKKIVGEQGLYDEIVKEKRDCVLFLSATFCRTCKTLNPRFTTLARKTMEQSEEEEDEDGILFAKADATGEVGKDLSRLLNVEAVPAFLLFRKGRRFGPALSISRIPSKKLSAAIDLLESGMDWDSTVVQQSEEKRR